MRLIIVILVMIGLCLWGAISCSQGSDIKEKYSQEKARLIGACISDHLRFHPELSEVDKDKLTKDREALVSKNEGLREQWGEVTNKESLGGFLILICLLLLALGMWAAGPPPRY